MRRILITAASLVVLALAGCGGSSTARHAVVGSCATAPGTAAGETLVGDYSTARYQSAAGITLGFNAWVSGQAARAGNAGAPATALCGDAREAAAAVVLSYAARHRAAIMASSAPKYGGRDLIGYLNGQGVRCGSECEFQPGAQGAAIAKQAASSTRAANKGTATTEAVCQRAEGAASKLVADDGAAIKHPTGDTGATLNADISALRKDLPELKPQASSTERAQLRSNVVALGRMSGSGSGDSGALALTYWFRASPFKQLPALLGSICG